MKIVSIIIPLHNAEAYILETLKSCFEQIYTNIEVIVVENGSSDNSWEFLNTIADTRLQCYQIDIANASAARNFGYKKATGDYIMFLDADDIVSKTKIDKQLRVLENLEEGWIASCAWGKFTNTIEQASFIQQDTWRIKDPVQWCITSWNGGGMMIPGCWLIPKPIIEKAGLWNETLTLHDDGEFMCRVLLASQGNVFVENAWVYYRQVSNSLSRKNQSYKAAKSTLDVCESYRKHVLPLEDSPIVRQALAYNYRRFMYEFHPNHKDLLHQAKQSIQTLGVKNTPLIGGENFKKLSKIVGFYNALSLRESFNNVMK
tara:strand:+ start:2169 stop:3116 length:948 start_codon:yes stop_codon:yes gene_type:complete